MSRVSDYLEPLRNVYYDKGRQQAIDYLCHHLRLTKTDADTCLTHLQEDGLLSSRKTEKPYRLRKPRKLRKNAQEYDDSTNGVVIDIGSL